MEKRDEKMTVSRRGFITGSALLGLGATVGLAGCQPQAPQEELSATGDTGTTSRWIGADAELPTEISSDAEEVEYDVVVIGAGTSGTCAGLAAAEAGARTVIIEKTDITGGLSNYSVGIMGAGSALQKEEGRSVSADDLFKVHREYYKNTCYAPLARNIFDSSGETIDWLAENGVGFGLQPLDTPFQTLPEPQATCGHMMLGPTKEPSDSRVTKGNLCGLYASYLEDFGGELMLETRAFKLITDDSGDVVTGVACQKDDGSQVIVHGKAFVLAAGSWSADTDYCREHLAHGAFYESEAISANTGDGIEIARQIGAQPWISVPNWHQVWNCMPDGTMDYSLRCSELVCIERCPAYPWIDLEGYRFSDETAAGDYARFAHNAVSTGGSYWLLLDKAMVDGLENEGTPVENICCYPAPIPFLTGNENININLGAKSGPMTGITKFLDDYADQGYIIKASDLDDLCEQCNLSREAVDETIREYNEAVSTGVDKLFCKDPKYLVCPIGEGPYYAVRMLVNVEGVSLGGIRVNKNLKVYKQESAKPFDNLFAAGTNAGGHFGIGGYSDIGGCTMGYATTSGRLAGSGAAALAL